jgi:hypothetical protein
MALYKMNRLHLHLTDDQGWRIEIKSKPELTNLGSKGAVEGGRSGYLTQEEYKELQSLCLSEKHHYHSRDRYARTHIFSIAGLPGIEL